MRRNRIAWLKGRDGQLVQDPAAIEQLYFFPISWLYLSVRQIVLLRVFWMVFIWGSNLDVTRRKGDLFGKILDRLARLGKFNLFS